MRQSQESLSAAGCELEPLEKGGGLPARSDVERSTVSRPVERLQIARARDLDGWTAPEVVDPDGAERSDRRQAPPVRSNVPIAYFAAGHMMYVHPPSMHKVKGDLAAFVDANAR